MLSTRSGGDEPLRQGQLVLIPPDCEIVGAPAAAESNAHLWDYLWLIWRYRRLLALVFVVCIGLATLITLKRQPLYEAVAKLRIEPEAPKILDFQDEQVAINTSRDINYIETQRQVLTSRVLAEKVIERLGPEVVGLQPAESAQDWHRFLKLSHWLPPLRTTPGVVAADASTSNAQRVKNQELVAHFLEALTVAQVRSTEVVEIRYLNDDPTQSARVVNSLANAYIQSTFETKYNAYEHAREWLEDKLDELKGKLESSEEQLYSYGKGPVLSAAAEDTEKLTEQMELKRQRVVEAEREVFEKRQRFELWQSNPEIATAQGPEDATIRELVDRRLELETHQRELAQNLGPQADLVQQNQAALDQLGAQLSHERTLALQRSERDFQQASERLKYAESVYQREQERVHEIQQGLIKYKILKREVEVNRELYNNLLQRWKEVGVASGIRASNVTLVEPAVVPLEPKLPNRGRDIALGAIVGLLLGIALIFFVEYMDTSIKSSEELERHVGLPALGLIPCAQTHKHSLPPGTRIELLSHNNPKSMFADAFRAVRTSIQYSRPGRMPKKLLVTSSFPSEGKSTVSTNLAIVLAQQQHKVLLIDADLRKPILHKFMDVDRNNGLAEMLTGHHDLSVIHSSHIPNLSVIASGAKSPNPVDLLDSSMMRQLLTDLEAKFDYIILDTAPILNLADTAALAPLVDGVILVARPGKTPRAALARAREVLAETHCPLLGVILNNPHGSSFGQTHAYGYGYDYGYGYGYGASYGEETPTERAPALNASALVSRYPASDEPGETHATRNGKLRH
jgi:capsular exopolysaccharide synthesis family protein